MDSVLGAVVRFDEDRTMERVVTFAPRFDRLEGLAIGDAGELFVGIKREPPLSGLLLELTAR